MDLYAYLLETYGYDEPIFTEDLEQELNIKEHELLQKLEKLTDSKKIERYEYEKGIYFIPDENWKNSILKKQKPILSVEKIIRKKYIMKNGKRFGYETGFSFANHLMLTTQVPSTISIVTHKEHAESREIVLRNRYFILHRPKTIITESNYQLLQILDLLSNFRYSDVSLEKATPIILKYLENVSLSQEEMDECIQAYPNIADNHLYSDILDQIAKKIKK